MNDHIKGEEIIEDLHFQNLAHKTSWDGVFIHSIILFLKDIITEANEHEIFSVILKYEENNKIYTAYNKGTLKEISHHLSFFTKTQPNIIFNGHLMYRYVDDKDITEVIIKPLKKKAKINIF